MLVHHLDVGQWPSMKPWFFIEWFGIGFFLNWECDRRFVEYRHDDRENSGPNTCKARRQDLAHSGRISYHRGIDGDDILVSRGVRGWWVVRGISGRATWITTWRGDLVCIALIPRYKDCFYSTLLHSDLGLAE